MDMNMSLRASLRLLVRSACLLAMLGAICGIRVFAESKPSTSVVTAPHLKVSLVADKATLPPDATGTHVGLLFDLQPGWHIYWTNAGDSGEPPAVSWTLPQGVSTGPLQFPAPKRLPLGPLMDFGYETQVLFPAALNVP